MSVKEHTGQVIGEVVWAASGLAKSVFPTTFDQLLALTGGNAADVAAEEQDIHP